MQASDAPDRILQKNLQNYNKIYKQAIKCFNWKPQKRKSKNEYFGLVNC